MHVVETVFSPNFQVLQSVKGIGFYHVTTDDIIFDDSEIWMTLQFNIGPKVRFNLLVSCTFKEYESNIKPKLNESVAKRYYGNTYQFNEVL